MKIRGMILAMSLSHYLWREKFDITRQVLFSIVIATIVSAAVSYFVNVKLDQRVTERQFIYDYSRIFFDNPKYRDVSVALEEEYLYDKAFLKSDGSVFTDYDIDDYLYLLQEIWSFYQIGYISEDVLNEQYRYFVCIARNSPTMQQYRSKLMAEGFKNPHRYLDDFGAELGVQGRDCRTY